MTQPITDELETKMRAVHDFIEATFPNSSYFVLLASDDEIPQVDLIANIDAESCKIMADIAFDGVEEGGLEPPALLQ